jgi:hypothetical protein
MSENDEPLSDEFEPWVSNRVGLLPPRSKTILQLLDQLGELETSEIVAALDLDSTGQVNYQVKEYILDDHYDRQLVELSKADRSGGGTPPNKIKLTPAGETAAEWLRAVEDPEDFSLTERLERIETLVDGLVAAMDRLDELEERIEKLESKPDRRKRGRRRRPHDDRDD